MRVLLASFVVASAVSATASADLQSWVAPSWRGEANSQFYQWDAFSSASFGPNFATAGGPSAQLFNFRGGSFLTPGDSGDVISGDGGLDIHVYGGGTPTSDVVLQVTYDSFTATPAGVDFFIGSAGPGASGEYFDFVSTERLYEKVLDRGVIRVTDSFTFDLSGYAGSALNWAAFFEINGPTTLQGLSIDVRGVVPAPGVLATLALAGFARRRRRG